jgi:hypothetical protein
MQQQRTGMTSQVPDESNNEDNEEEEPTNKMAD